MLCCLKDAGYRLAVASSSPKPVITETLETLDLMKYFDVVTSGDEVKNPKQRAENHKKRYGIEYFSKKDIERAIHEVKRATNDFFNS